MASEPIKDPSTWQWLLGFVGGGGIVSLFAIFRKEHVDKQIAVKQRLVAYHLKRKEQLANLISNLSEAEYHYTQARNIHKNLRDSGAMQNVSEPLGKNHEQALDKYREFLARGDEAFLRATIEGELYGSIPEELKVENRSLHVFNNAVCYLRLKNLYTINDKESVYTDMGRHLEAYKKDLRCLMVVEEQLSQFAATGKGLHLSKYDFPYLLEADGKVHEEEVDIRRLKFDDF